MTLATRTPIRVALIGYGLAGRVFHAPLIDAEPRLSLRMVATRDPARMEAVRAGLPQVDVVPPDVALSHPDIDLVVVASPHDSHARLARSAREAGKHVVVDKPFTLSLAVARELRDRATRTGRLLSVFQNRRWDSDFLALRHAVDAGLIGRPLHLESRFERFRPDVRDRWRAKDACTRSGTPIRHTWCSSPAMHAQSSRPDSWPRAAGRASCCTATAAVSSSTAATRRNSNWPRA